MGYLKKIILFDYVKFRDEVVPAFREGASHPLVRDEIEHYYRNKDDQEMVPDFDSLATVMSHYNEDFSTSTLERLFCVDDGKILPWPGGHNLSKRSWSKWELTDLFEYAVTRYCARYHLGISGLTIESSVRTSDKAMQTLIDKLVSGAPAWQGCDGGIQGWLSNEEVHVFGQKMASLEVLDVNVFERIRPLMEIADKEDLGVMYLEDVDLYIHGSGTSNLVKLTLGDFIGTSGEPLFEGEALYRFPGDVEAGVDYSVATGEPRWWLY